MISSIRTSHPLVYEAEGGKSSIRIPFKKRRKCENIQYERMSFLKDDVSIVQGPFRYAVETGQLPKFKELFNATDRGPGRNYKNNLSICDVEGFNIFSDEATLFWQRNISTDRLIGQKRNLQIGEQNQGDEMVIDAKAAAAVEAAAAVKAAAAVEAAAATDAHNRKL